MIDNAKLKDLDHFTGTEAYHKLSVFQTVVFTDGIKYVAENASAFWLIDAIAGRLLSGAYRGEDLASITLTLADRGASAMLEGTDGNKNLRFRDRIPFTDFPAKEFKCFASRTGEDKPAWVVMLPSEY